MRGLFDFNKPVISVIIPSHNHANKLPGAIESVLEQDFQDFELIVIDDNSNDDTESVLSSFTDDRIVRLKNKTCLGVYKTANLGFKFAKGEYFCQLDADDMLCPGSLSLRYNYLTSHSLQAVHTGISVVNNGFQNYIPPLDTGKRDNIISFLKQNNSKYGINACTFLFGRKIIEQIGYRDESDVFFPHNDYEYALRILLNGKTGFINESTYSYQRHAGSHSDIYSHDSISHVHLQLLRDKYIREFSS